MRTLEKGGVRVLVSLGIQFANYRRETVGRSSNG
jgi:hypothetical protein